MSQHKVVLLLGSNLGDQKKNIELALQKISEGGNYISQISEFLITEPIEFVSSNIFCNIASEIFTSLSPIQLLDFIKDIEVGMGRIKDSSASGGYSDRIIDIDIIKYNDLIFRSERLEIPHQKHLYEREFSKVLLKDFI
ncbi:2-amino-4-hydroxy-6-hydroxymethyldihydropteridine diphosphokinase [Chryseobacterium elymi]|uniref:2-amino-4-hydroxy-6-hydroxymethyldihydropteridine pyrophosphokinase n=1 Tax=Chryseobacterium elymi TaxID=395936 RepID=A0A3D9DDL6_9FLAO|nr:2-amino-4-hydroxy-6-hydroxymethyldihydropteridine diphosphokinase [Chryseobacterium elymi]REC76117.1 2-amino-4-hydroxy-6-hydroxymethyldihydropteridine diphosphokinase [Chryseobacterium elymi]